MEKEKVLIIKTGFAEVLETNHQSRVHSKGDVLRTTPLLHKYKDSNVTWLTSEGCVPLLEGNPYIERILVLDFINSLQLESEEFDRVINLEKIPGICALSDKIRARKSRYGFTFCSQTGEPLSLENASEVFALSTDYVLKKTNKKTFQELLFEIVGEDFKGEECILGYKPKTKEEYDVGLNIFVGKKWPNKSLPIKIWDNLERKLKEDKFTVSRQDKQDKEILGDIFSYADWINSCKLIVSNDSLGLHLGLVLGKNVLGLFGPTPPQEVHFYERGKAILPEKSFDCMPCFKNKCIHQNSCMEHISVESIFKEVKNYFKAI